MEKNKNKKAPAKNKKAPAVQLRDGESLFAHGSTATDLYQPWLQVAVAAHMKAEKMIGFRLVAWELARLADQLRYLESGETYETLWSKGPAPLFAPPTKAPTKEEMQVWFLDTLRDLNPWEGWENAPQRKIYGLAYQGHLARLQQFKELFQELCVDPPATAGQRALVLVRWAHLDEHPDLEELLGTLL